jgi:hypothetical protein
MAQVLPDVGRCDFCSAAPVVVRYPADDITLAAVEGPQGFRPAFVSKGAWLACLECSILIDTNQWPALEDRACELLERRGAVGDDMSPEVLRLWVLTAQEGFRTARTGPGVLL